MVHNEDRTDGAGGVHFDFILPGGGVEGLGREIAGGYDDGVEGRLVNVGCKFLTCVFLSDVDVGDILYVFGCFWGSV